MCIILQLISLGESTANGAIAVQISCKNFGLRDLGCGRHSARRGPALAAQVHRWWSTKEAANRRNAVHSLPWFSTNSRLPVLLPERHLASPTLTFPPGLLLIGLMNLIGLVISAASVRAQVTSQVGTPNKPQLADQPASAKEERSRLSRRNCCGS